MVNLFRYILKKILAAIPLFFIITFLVFVIPRYSPGSPLTHFQDLTGKPVPQAVIDALVEKYDDGRPLIIQYFSYMGEVFTGNFGETLTVAPGTPIIDILKIIIPRTMELTLIPFILSSYVGIRLGIFASKHHNKLGDALIRLLSLVSTSMPIFWFAALLKYFSGYYLQIWTNGVIDDQKSSYVIISMFPCIS